MTNHLIHKQIRFIIDNLDSDLTWWIQLMILRLECLPNISLICICIPERFNTNISQQFFDYKITFVNSQRENTNSKGDFVLNNQFTKDFWYTKINLSQTDLVYQKYLKLAFKTGLLYKIITI